MSIRSRRRALLVQRARKKDGAIVVRQQKGGWLALASELTDIVKEELLELNIYAGTVRTTPPLYIPLDNETYGGARVPRRSLYDKQIYVSEDGIRYYPSVGTLEQMRLFFTDDGDFQQPALYTNGRYMHPVSMINREAPLVRFYRWTQALNRRMAIHTAIAEGGTITHLRAGQLGGNVRLSIAAEQLFSQGYDVSEAFGEMVERGLLDGYLHPGAPYVRMLSLASTHFYVHPTHLVTRDGLKNTEPTSE